MTKDEALKLALEALEVATTPLAKDRQEVLRAQAAIREVLAQPEQEPVALQMDVIVVNLVREGINKHRARELAEHFIKHTTPPQRTWIGLTDEDKQTAFDETQEGGSFWEFADAIEAKLKEKNT